MSDFLGKQSSNREFCSFLLQIDEFGTRPGLVTITIYHDLKKKKSLFQNEYCIENVIPFPQSVIYVSQLGECRDLFKLYAALRNTASSHLVV